MHVTVVLDAIKKRGHFKDYKKAEKAYVEHKQAVEAAKAGLALLDRTSTVKKNCKKRRLWRLRKLQKEALAKVLDPKSEAKKAEEVPKVT